MQAVNDTVSIFSERELTVTFAICYRPSVCCLSVYNVDAPYSAAWTFRQFFYALWYIGHSLTSTEIFTEIVPGEPLRRGANIAILDIWNAVSSKRCKIGGKVVLITKRKSYMSFRLVPKSVTLNDLERRNGPYFALFYRIWNFFGRIAKKWLTKAITVDNLRLLCLVINICRGTARHQRYEYSITARWKFCRRFINSRFIAEYMPGYGLFC